MEIFITARLCIYVSVTLICFFLAAWFESVPGNGARSKVRLLLLPTLVTWVTITVSTILKIAGYNDNTGYLFFLAGLYSVISLASFVWQSRHGV